MSSGNRETGPETSGTFPDPLRERGRSGPTPPDVLAILQAGGVLPIFWRRKRKTSPWHRGFRVGSMVVRSMCAKVARSDGGRLLYAPIEEPWPLPHCRACETATPGTDAAREGLDPNEGVSSSWPGRSHPVRRAARRHGA